MKPLRLIIIMLVLFFARAIQAQVSINLNIGARPAWGPVVESDVRYYYLPEVEAYYDIPTARFIYMDNGAWVHRHRLPSRFRDYDLYHGRKIVISDYRGNSPYTHCSYPQRYAPVRGHDHYDYDRPGRAYYRQYDRQPHEVFDRERGNGHGRGHAYGKHKEWKD